VDLEQAIHERWAADSALAALLPADAVVTGTRGSRDVPYATVHRKANRTVLRTNAGAAVDEAILAIHVWHDDYDAGRAIVRQVQAAFELGDFALSGDDRVIQMRRVADSAEQHDDGLWQFSIDFLVQVYFPSGM
jgi:hypothetical protein